MKKYLLLLFLFFSTSVFAENMTRVKEVVIFSQPCFYCEKLKTWLKENKVEEKYPDVKFTILDIQERKNYNLLLQKIKEYNIDGNRVGMPLIFVGKNYIMGWTDSYSTTLDNYINNYYN